MAGALVRPNGITRNSYDQTFLLYHFTTLSIELTLWLQALVPFFLLIIFFRLVKKAMLLLVLVCYLNTFSPFTCTSGDLPV